MNKQAICLETLAKRNTVDVAFFLPDIRRDLCVPPRRREAKWGKNRRQVKDGGRRGRRRRRSEADLIHRFDFIIRDEANRK